MIKVTTGQLRPVLTTAAGNMVGTWSTVTSSVGRDTGSEAKHRRIELRQIRSFPQAQELS